MSAPYKAAVIGCGRIGCSFDDSDRGYVSSHAGAYAKTPQVQLAALVDIDLPKARKYAERYGVAAYEDAATMLREQRPDIVSVCTLPGTHRDLVVSAAEAGASAVFCEKPIAATVSEADDMIAACRSAGALLFVDHQRRFDQFHGQAAALLRSGRLGRVQQVTAYYTAGLMNTGTHLVDLLRMFLGEVEWVQAMPSRNESRNPADANLDAWLQFVDGPRATVQACDVKAFTIFEINFLAEAGRLRVGEHGFSAEFEEARESRRFAGYRELYRADVPRGVDAAAPREYMLQAVRHIVDCLDGRATPVSSGEDGRATLQVLEALKRSANAHGDRVGLPVAQGVSA